jgi:hypothetical protein
MRAFAASANCHFQDPLILLEMPALPENSLHPRNPVRLFVFNVFC